MNKSIIAEKRALSPVIATVILISVTIVVAVSVAYWMGSIAGGYTAFEQIELPTVYAKYVSDVDPGTDEAPGWLVYINLKNTGSADATIDSIFINAVPITDYTSGVWLSTDGGTTFSTPTSIDIKVSKGGTASIVIAIEDDDGETVEGATSGTRIDIKLHSAAGRDYPAQVKLP